ncbi:MAG TPA: hypothetical protein VMR34_05140 [Candidatus Saccharimonadales bacterium]|nr:hypothetical protein [Candidatus Saccharimonadales bacterium]
MSSESDELLAKAKAREKANSTTQPAQTDNIQVKVYSPFKTFFDGSATSISAVNATGPFDILPSHHKFITLLSEGDVVIRSKTGEQKIPAEKGIMRVSNNRVVVYLGI